MKDLLAKLSYKPLILLSLGLWSCGGAGQMISTPSITEDMIACRTHGKWQIIAAPQKFGENDEIGMLSMRPEVDPSFALIPLRNTPIGYQWHPLGMTLSPSQGKQKQPEFFVINNATRCVDRFRIEHDSCHYISSSPPFSAEFDGNALTASSDGTLYLTSFGLSSKPCLPTKPDDASADLRNSIKMLRPGSQKWTTLALGIHGANGIAMGPDEKSLLVCSWKNRWLWQMPRDERNGTLTFPATCVIKDLPFHPDNLKQQPNGNYELCGHIGIGRTIAHMIFKVPVGKAEWVTVVPGERKFEVIEHPGILPRSGFCASSAQPLPHGVLFTQTGRAGAWWHDFSKHSAH